MDITTTVTWQDLREAQQRDLDELREAYDELRDAATDEYGDDALTQPVPDDYTAIEDDARLKLAVYQQQAQMYEQSAKTLQKRLNLLDVLESELGGEPFKIKMLSGEEAMATEVDLRTDVQASGDGGERELQLKRNKATVNAATVDAPDGVPRDDDGSPVPSECPNALVNALFGKVEKFNSAGDPDFRGAGFGGPTGAGSTPAVSSAPRSDASTPSESSAPSVTDAQPRGDSS
jgi:hypothetical protein